MVGGLAQVLRKIDLIQMLKNKGLGKHEYCFLTKHGNPKAPI